MPRHDDLIRAWLDDLALRGCSPRTIRLYRILAGRAQRDLPYGIAEANPTELRAWLATPGWSLATRRTYRGMLRGFYAWATAEGHLDWDPTTRIPQIRVPTRLPRPATDDQVAEILARAAQPVRLWAHIAAYTGARCIEIARLHRGDIARQTTRLYGKGSKERVVPTHPALWAAVTDLDDGPVAGGATADDISARAAREIRRLCDDRWRPRITMHRLRSWYATRILDLTGDIRAAQQLLGHASPATTAVYAAASSRALAHAVSGLPDLTTTPNGAAGVDPAPVDPRPARR